MNRVQITAVSVRGVLAVLALLFPPYDQCGEFMCGGEFYWFWSRPTLSPEDVATSMEGPFFVSSLYLTDCKTT